MNKNWLLLAALICFLNVKGTRTGDVAEKDQSVPSNREKSFIISTIASTSTEEIGFDYEHDSDSDEYEDDLDNTEEYYDDDDEDQEDDEPQDYDQDEEEYQNDDYAETNEIDNDYE